MLNAGEGREVWHNFFILRPYCLWLDLVIGTVEVISDGQGDKSELHGNHSTFNLVFHNAITMKKPAL